MQDAIAKTKDLEAQVLAYDYLGQNEWNLNRNEDKTIFLKTIGLAETLPENSYYKYRVLYESYQFLYYLSLDDIASWKNYLDKSIQAADRTHDANYICEAWTSKYNYYTYLMGRDSAKYYDSALFCAQNAVALTKTEQKYINKNIYIIAIAQLIEILYYNPSPQKQEIRKYANQLQILVSQLKNNKYKKIILHYQYQLDFANKQGKFNP